MIVLEKRKTILPFIIKYFETDDEKESFFWKDKETNICERKNNIMKENKQTIKKILCLWLQQLNFLAKKCLLSQTIIVNKISKKI